VLKLNCQDVYNSITVNLSMQFMYMKPHKLKLTIQSNACAGKLISKNF